MIVDTCGTAIIEPKLVSYLTKTWSTASLLTLVILRWQCQLAMTNQLKYGDQSPSTGKATSLRNSNEPSENDVIKYIEG